MVDDGSGVEVTGDIIRRSAERSPERAAVVFGERSWSYAELDRASWQCAHALAERLPGQSRVGFMLRNSPAYAIGFYGAARAGSVSVHVSHRYTASELAFVCRQTGVETWIVDGKTRATAEAALRELSMEAHLIDASQFESWLDGRVDEPLAHAVRPEDPLCIQYTSGTTGDPKGVVLNHRARLLSAVAAVEDIPLELDDVVAVTTPLCHAAGIFTWFQPALLAGATCVFLNGWSARELMAQVPKHGITAAFMVPSQIAMLVAEGQTRGFGSLRGLRKIVYGGAPASETLIERAEAELPDVAFVQALGSTETGHLLCQSPSERRANPRSVGRPGPRIEHCLFTEAGSVAATGVVGELAIRGQVLMDGYLDAPEETRAYFRADDGWGFTGDLAVANEDGVLTLIGRTQERILTGGINVYPAELERRLATHPGVAESAVFAVPDPKWGELPAAAVVLRSEAAVTGPELLAFAAQETARFKRIRHVFIVNELPKTASGKVKRTVLKERYSSAASTD